MLRLTTAAVLLAFVVPFALPAAAEDPTTGNCDRVPVPVNINVGFVCALAGLGTNASCPPNGGVPVDVSCSSLYSWNWLAFSSLELAGDVAVTIRSDVAVCVDLIDEPPVCTHHAREWTEQCAWDVGKECRGEGRVDEVWGPQHLDMGEQFKVLVHIDIHMDATSNAEGIPVGEVSYGDFSDWGAVVEVVNDGR